ncbi:MAG: HDOD domain-containing protein [Proteobacteria bacterium]|nr:HDOD domain-containing protein [Desulfobulbaceae bacterium]MBU4152044.1 HDOD domain-containing protein [Pseudomonadota bacterium]MDP2107101.1 HDOD domain-containing protein [Desulfobulbaceae bacterium]
MFTSEQIIDKFNTSKTLPHVAIRVTQMVNDDNSTMRDFEEIIQMDPVLVSRLLKLVNSPYFGLSGRVDSIAKAVVMVGMKNLRNLVAVEGLRGMFHDEGNDGFSRQHLWLHSATVAILCDMIGKRIFGDAREDLFLAGIIHDIGYIAEDQVAGNELREACRRYQPGKNSFIACEREVIGTDHADVGYKLAKEWKMPPDVLIAIRDHHNMGKKPEPSSVCGIVQLSEYIAGKMKFSVLSDRVEPLPAHLVPHVKSMMDNYKVIVRDLPKEMERAKSLYSPEP